MQLYAVIVTDTYPAQVIVVWDRQESALKLSEHLNETIAPKTRVERVDSFFPVGMCEAGMAWLNAADSYLGCSHMQGNAECF